MYSEYSPEQRKKFINGFTDLLRTAAGYGELPPSWDDGEFTWTAGAVKVFGPHDPHPGDYAIEGYAKIPEMTVRDNFMNYSRWALFQRRTGALDKTTDVYEFGAGETFNHTLEGAVSDEPSFGTPDYPAFTINRLWPSIEEDLEPVTDDQFFHTLRALLSLKPYADQLVERYFHIIKNESEEETMQRRLARYDVSYVLGGNAESIKTKEIDWHYLECDNSVYAVYASSLPTACILLEDLLDRKFEGVHNMFVLMQMSSMQEEGEDPLPEDHYGDGVKITRLIPYSRVAWPEDPDNMTDEQQAAFDRL